LVFPAKYRRVVFDKNVDEVLKEVCIKIEDRYQIVTGHAIFPLYGH
jgi:hypothetical protein